MPLKLNPVPSSAGDLYLPPPTRPVCLLPPLTLWFLPNPSRASPPTSCQQSAGDMQFYELWYSGMDRGIHHLLSTHHTGYKMDPDARTVPYNPAVGIGQHAIRRTSVTREWPLIAPAGGGRVPGCPATSGAVRFVPVFLNHLKRTSGAIGSVSVSSNLGRPVSHRAFFRGPGYHVNRAPLWNSTYSTLHICVNAQS